MSKISNFTSPKSFTFRTKLRICLFSFCTFGLKSFLKAPKGVTVHSEIVTFDQNGQNAVSAEFGILAASLPNWRFRTDKDVI